MGFFLFVLMTAVLFIRPTDFVPSLQNVNLYLALIVPCLVLSWHKLVPQLTAEGLRHRPVVVFALGILLLRIVVSTVHGQLDAGLTGAFELLKVILLCLLILAHLDSPGRFRLFLRCLALIILIPILLTVLNYHSIISIPAFTAQRDDWAGGAADTGVVQIRRLVGSGLFEDPNDVCEIINCAIIYSLYGLLDWRSGPVRALWLGPLVLFGHALRLTQSRGGFLGFAVGLLVLFRSRFRGTRSLVLLGVTMTLLLAVFGGRQTSISTSKGTSQQRIQLWDSGFEMMKQSPLIGTGIGEFKAAHGHVAHNAFIQVYAELGLLVGTLLFGQHFYCLTSLARLSPSRGTLSDPELPRLQPYILASMASYATSEMSVTNGFSVVTYAMFGLASAFIRLADSDPPRPDLQLSRTLVRRVAVGSALFLLALYVFVRISVQYV